ncbi:MFS transporter [Photobacterium sp. SDRW27]|uniref:MFS transporter n=1 Tax=Photobacterium obscurum TaxID=2829490 RepID=UPI0022438F66|nr:MFS transporter [Photobacterium obscurum]MCW8328498.1 MFS transporter [Photobacterium obscurum]
MSLISMPFVDSGVDTALHIVAAVVLIGTVAAAIYGFWRIHELPIQKAHTKEHHQIGLITALTWIGFVWHWVWVVAVAIAFVDGEQALRRIRDIWKGADEEAPVLSAGQQSTSENKLSGTAVNLNKETEHA